MCALMSSCGRCQDGFDYDVPALSSYDVDGKKKKKKRKDHEQVRGGADGGGDRVKKKKLKVKDGKCDREIDPDLGKVHSLLRLTLAEKYM